MGELDLSELKIKADRLKELIAPAIKAFIADTGKVPNIGTVIVTHQTRCGITEQIGDVEVKVSIQL